VPTKSCSQWQSLAQEIIDSIRAVDPHHILFVERVNWLKFEPAASDKENIYFPDVTDPAPKKNIVFEYHMYSPIEFTHQNAFWIPYFKGKFCVYPDASRVNAEGERWAGFSDVNPTAGNGSFEWKSLQGERAMPDKKEYRIGKPVIQVQNIGGSGKVWFDDVTVEVFSPAGKKLRTLSTPVDESGGWYFWSGNNSGNMESVSGIDGASGGKCMLVRGTTGDAVLSCDALRFVIDPKNTYTVSGKVRGDNVASSAVVRFRLDYYNCDTVYSWNKKGLQSIIDAYTRFAKRKNSPVYLGEFGLYRETFVENRGGERWLTDVLDILTAGNVNYNYHTYHEWGFGIYANDDSSLPDPKLINEPVAKIFRSKQKKGGVRK
jgi:endoglucanase